MEVQRVAFIMFKYYSCLIDVLSLLLAYCLLLHSIVLRNNLFSSLIQPTVYVIVIAYAFKQIHWTERHYFQIRQNTPYFLWGNCHASRTVIAL